MNLAPIIPQRRAEPFNDLGLLFELKYDGFRSLADTVNGRMWSRQFAKHTLLFHTMLAVLALGCGSVAAQVAASTPSPQRLAQAEPQKPGPGVSVDAVPAPTHKDSDSAAFRLRRYGAAPGKQC